jgi:hypothetical protein
MIQIDIKIDDKLTPVLKGMAKELKRYPQDAEDKYVSLTPIKSGNARNNTYLQGQDRIVANYAYAQRLDEGHSKQAPRGMTQPFEAWVRQKTRQIFGR